MEIKDMQLEGGKLVATVTMAVEALPAEQQPQSCLACGACAAICPQKIDIPACMQELSERIAKIPSWAEISRQRAAQKA